MYIGGLLVNSPLNGFDFVFDFVFDLAFGVGLNAVKDVGTEEFRPYRFYASSSAATSLGDSPCFIATRSQYNALLWIALSC